jgi:hypothetical protein
VAYINRFFNFYTNNNYLHKKLNSHNINNEIKLNELFFFKKTFCSEEKFKRMKELNPALDTLRKLFDLDV